MSIDTALYCDMDMVLVNFLGGVKKVLGGRSFDHPDFNGVNKVERHALINKHKDFWPTLPWMPDGQELWEYVKVFKPYILSAYAEWDSRTIPGKNQWIQKHLGDIPKQKILLVRRVEKQNFAVNQNTGKPNVLIDDHSKNCDEWRQAGGIPIQHVGTKSTILKLKELGFRK